MVPESLVCVLTIWEPPTKLGLSRSRSSVSICWENKWTVRGCGLKRLQKSGRTDLQIIILSEVSQTEKDKYHMMLLICGILKNDTWVSPVLQWSASMAGGTGLIPGWGCPHVMRHNQKIKYKNSTNEPIYKSEIITEVEDKHSCQGESRVGE